jgi:hypothetical protein
MDEKKIDIQEYLSRLASLEWNRCILHPWPISARKAMGVFPGWLAALGVAESYLRHLRLYLQIIDAESGEITGTLTSPKNTTMNLLVNGAGDWGQRTASRRGLADGNGRKARSHVSTLSTSTGEGRRAGQVNGWGKSNLDGSINSGIIPP